MMALPRVMMALPLGLQESDIPDPQAKLYMISLQARCFEK